MRRFNTSAALVLLILLVFSAALAADIEVPKPTGYVNDLANILSPQDEAAITGYIGSLKEATTAEIAVVTVKSVKPYPIEQYAMAIADEWKVGDKEKDNGVIVLVAVDDRETRIEVAYGLEHLIPDAEAWDIINTIMLPAFRDNNYPAGIKGAVAKIGAIIAKDAGVTVAQPAMPVPRTRSYGRKGGIPCFFIIFLILVFFLRLRLWPFLLLGGLSRGRYWSGGGFSGGSGGFSGGFGGFGGGSFGGGGASGSW